MKKIILAVAVLGTMSLMADGAALYKKCAACHGAKGEKAALGKSAVIGGMDTAALVADLKGYKAGTTNKKGMTTKFTRRKLFCQIRWMCLRKKGKRDLRSLPVHPLEQI